MVTVPIMAEVTPTASPPEAVTVEPGPVTVMSDVPVI